MPEQKLKEENLYNIIREIEHFPYITQRALSTKLGISLGKTNYLLKELIRKGLVEAKSFSEPDGENRKAKYVITDKGLSEKIHMTRLFLERKKAEYETFRKEYRNLEKRLI
jgi:EPS-associated MarR family transcriptional regulator